MKPIAFFDLESTGVDLANDRIIQIAILKVYVDEGIEHLSDYRTEKLVHYVNPQRPILNSEIHGITDEMVKDAPTFNSLAPDIIAFLSGCDLSGFNIVKFDIPLLAEEVARAGFNFSLKERNVIDPFILYKILNSQSLSAAYKKYTGNELEGAHDAMNDVLASFEVLKGMIVQQHVPSDLSELLKFQAGGKEFDSTVDFAGKFIRNKDGEIILNFGKHKGEKAKDHLDFVSWMQGKDFTRDTLAWVDELLPKWDSKDDDDDYDF